MQASSLSVALPHKSLPASPPSPSRTPRQISCHYPCITFTAADIPKLDAELLLSIERKPVELIGGAWKQRGDRGQSEARTVDRHIMAHLIGFGFLERQANPVRYELSDAGRRFARALRNLRRGPDAAGIFLR